MFIQVLYVLQTLFRNLNLNHIKGHLKAHQPDSEVYIKGKGNKNRPNNSEKGTRSKGSLSEPKDLLSSYDYEVWC